MDQKTFSIVAGVIFAAVALFHLVRIYMDWPVTIGCWSVPMWVSWIGLVVAGGLGRRRPSFSIAHQAGARHLPEKRCKSLATSRSTMRAPSRIWRKRVWRQSQLRSSGTAKAFGQLLARPMCAGKLARTKSSRVVVLSENSIRLGIRMVRQNHSMIGDDARNPAITRNVLYRLVQVAAPA